MNVRVKYEDECYVAGVRDLADIIGRDKTANWKAVAGVLRDCAAIIEKISLAALRTPDGDKLAKWHLAAASIERGVRLHDMTDDEIGSILAALSVSRPVGEGWRPIESAPKDGTEIITYWLCDGKTEVSADTYWWERGDQWISHGDGSINPVAWQPLPEPPRSHAEDSSE